MPKVEKYSDVPLASQDKGTAAETLFNLGILKGDWREIKSNYEKEVERPILSIVNKERKE